MKRILLPILAIMLLSNVSFAQQKKQHAVDNFIDLTAGIGSWQGSGAL